MKTIDRRVAKLEALRPPPMSDKGPEPDFDNVTVDESAEAARLCRLLFPNKQP